MNLSHFIDKHKYKTAFSLFILYLCFSLYKIGENSLWGDECFSIDLGNHTIKEIIDYSWYKDTNPPLYLIIVHYWTYLFGDSEFALRSISAIATSLTCSIFFLFALRYFNWQTAIIVACLFFSSNEIYFYSQEGRTYGLVLLFCTLSNYAFMSLIQKPNVINALFLGLFNITIFYLHTLGCINIIGQVILIPILGYKNIFVNRQNSIKTILGYDKKLIVWYSFSCLVFLLLFLPWQERFFGIIKDGAKGFWLQKPTFIEYKQVLFDFCNSKNLFYLYSIIFTSVILILIFVKKYREKSFNYKLLLIPIILGPVLYNINFFAASITPIFLKRYVLFTLLGFFLTFAYAISSIKIKFEFKFLIVLALCFLSFLNIKIPKECYWDYKKGVKLLEDKVSPTTFIFTDIAMLFAYYIDRKGAFNAYENERYNLLAKKNVYTGGVDWPNNFDLSKYNDIYYTRSFESYNDPERKTEAILKQKFIWVEDLSVPGMAISHYKNYNPSPKTLDSLKQNIIHNVEWYNDVINKATKNNISIDSMVTLDAIWAHKNALLSKKTIGD